MGGGPGQPAIRWGKETRPARGALEALATKWFTPPAGCPQPPRYKMVLVTLLAVYPLISLVQLALVPLLGGWPLALRTLATSALLVCLMTYAAMPLATRLFARWLYGVRP